SPWRPGAHSSVPFPCTLAARKEPPSGKIDRDRPLAPHRLAHDLPLSVDQRKFYAELGHLLYALAAVDGRVQAQEIATMKRVVAEQLVPQEASKDHFGTDRAFITEFEFDVLVERGDPPEEAFGSFLTYF